MDGGGMCTRFKHFEQYFGTNHSNYETREREKERGEQIFSKLAIDC
jgi:hypothetical protein